MFRKISKRWGLSKSEDLSKIILENLECGINLFQKTWFFATLEYGVNIFPKTSTEKLVIWDQYFPKVVKWTLNYFIFIYRNLNNWKLVFIFTERNPPTLLPHYPLTPPPPAPSPNSGARDPGARGAAILENSGKICLEKTVSDGGLGESSGGHGPYEGILINFEPISSSMEGLRGSNGASMGGMEK